MFELQNNRITRAASDAETLLAEERARVREANHVSKREEHQALARLREQTRGFAAHDSSAYRDQVGMAARENNDLLDKFNAASANKPWSWSSSSRIARTA